MDPFTFLRDECESVKAALIETLRHDYGPEHGAAYYGECKGRLDSIGQAISDDPTMDRPTIAAHMRSLSALGSRISLIERSHLGEFSWPFAESIREIAVKLFVEKQLDGTSCPPIVHFTAEGMHYKMVDDALALVGTNRIVIVAFPRQLKHHVLLHSIFGHELGHTAFNSPATGLIITTRVLPAVTSRGPLQDITQAVAWLRANGAPQSVKDAISVNANYSFPESALKNWRIEIICDLFGLILFGPAFAAAHRTILEPLAPSSLDFDLKNTTHPPYTIRRRVITSAMKILKWDVPVTPKKHKPEHKAELALLKYATEDIAGAWFSIFTDVQLKSILEELKKIFQSHPGMAFQPLDSETLLALLGRLTLGRPPIKQTLSKEGIATNAPVLISHCLYAGWAFWFGQDDLQKGAKKNFPHLSRLSFLQINRLCDYAILQQRAIDAANKLQSSKTV